MNTTELEQPAAAAFTPQVLPPGTTPWVLSCNGCGRAIHTHVPYTQEELQNPALLEIINRLSRQRMQCAECYERGQSNQEYYRRQALSRQWEEICPLEFRATVISKLPNMSLYDQAMKWSYGPRGLVLNGSTGKGKSRIGWRLLEREHYLGRSVAFMDGSFGLEYASRYSKSASGTFEWLEELSTCKLLLMDDVLKIKLTDSAESAIFSIIEHRTTNCLPIIVTTNDTGDSLLARMSPDRGPAVVRRLREFCDHIHCK